MTHGGSRPPRPSERRLRIVHLFPDLLSVYGDSGNVRTLAARAAWRGISVEVSVTLADSPSIPVADLFVIGGGQDRDQAELERSLRRLGDGIRREVDDGAALLAVCGGYQVLGGDYVDGSGRRIRGVGIFDVETVARPGRLVGPVVARLTDPAFGAARTTVVGFENHSGRTTLGPSASPLARVEVGHGNNDEDGTEGSLALPGAGGASGLRIGTYLHGPLLPRNPHVADMLLANALGRDGQARDLAALDDTQEWAAHDRFVERCRQRSWVDRLPPAARAAFAPTRNLIGF